MKKSRIAIILISIIAIIFIAAAYNDKSALKYLEEKDPLFVGQETFYSEPHEESQVYIYRNTEGVNVVLMKWRDVLGWKMTNIDKIKFNNGPSWRYIEIELNDNRVIPVVYGFIYDNPNNYRGLRLKNKVDNIDRSPHSNLMHRTEIRAWYHFLDEPSSEPKQFILLDWDSEESLYEDID